MLQAGPANCRIKGGRDGTQALRGQLLLVPQPRKSQSPRLGWTPYRGRIRGLGRGPRTASILSARLQAETQYSFDEGVAVARPEYRRPCRVPGVRGKER